MKNLVLALAVAGFAQTAAADSLGPFDDLVLFGDSLSDPGNARDRFGELAVPSAAYPNGQLTNEDVWATILEQIGASISNFAFGGAKAATDADGADDFDAQIASYSQAVEDGLTLGKRPLAGVFFGGNDVRGAETFEEAQIAVLGAMQGLAAGISKLSAAGFEEFLVFGLPNLARLPAVVQSPTPADDAGALEASKGFNSALKGTLEALSTLGTFYFFDTFAFLEGEIAKAEAAGVNVTQSCLGTPGCSPANVKDFQILDPELTTGFVFYDDLHPTDRVHTALADAVTVYLEAIPLPAGGFLLIGALGAMGVASRRRVAVRTH